MKLTSISSKSGKSMRHAAGKTPEWMSLVSLYVLYSRSNFLLADQLDGTFTFFQQADANV
jgi:hypothetical protein